MTTNFESSSQKKPRDNQNFFLFFSSLILWVRLRLATFWRCSKYHGFVFSLPYLTSRVLIGFGGRKNWLLLSDVTSWRSQGKIRLLFMTSTIMTYFSEVIKVKVMVLCHYYIDNILFSRSLIWWGNTSLNFLKLQVWEILGVAACQSHLQTCRLVW